MTPQLSRVVEPHQGVGVGGAASDGTPLTAAASHAPSGLLAPEDLAWGSRRPFDFKLRARQGG